MAGPGASSAGPPRRKTSRGKRLQNRARCTPFPRTARTPELIKNLGNAKALPRLDEGGEAGQGRRCSKSASELGETSPATLVLRLTLPRVPGALSVPAILRPPAPPVVKEASLVSARPILDRRGDPPPFSRRPAPGLGRFREDLRAGQERLTVTRAGRWAQDPQHSQGGANRLERFTRCFHRTFVF